MITLEYPELNFACMYARMKAENTLIFFLTVRETKVIAPQKSIFSKNTA